MLARSTRRHVAFVFAAVAMTLAGALMAPALFARLSANTIDPVAIVTDNGRRLIVTGPISCTESEPAYLRVTVTQRSTGAVAEGSAHIACTPGARQWEVHASIQGNATFEEGPAAAVALARTTDRGTTDDAHQWLVNITLVRQ